jgi:hypothetical protein
MFCPHINSRLFVCYWCDFFPPCATKIIGLLFLGVFQFQRTKCSRGDGFKRKLSRREEDEKCGSDAEF